MISLDTSLVGEELHLRQSMVKFEGSIDMNIEICGVGLRPLPMILNRQLIKIMEDLGTNPEAFLNLQAQAVNQLRETIASASKAAKFLKSQTVGKTAKIPQLIKRIDALGLPYQKDSFLRQVVELAVLTRLREIKYRSRIPVDWGVTLYGIMDETGYLQEGEIYCCTQTNDDDRHVMDGYVIVTRSPALHPGDIRGAKAVVPPPKSPLNALHNCVVFSQHGERDLPSMLSGGDLDGDLYNVLYDPDLIPKDIYDPADYPPVDPVVIDRVVEPEDITDFFITFMENDQLGRIANLHQVLADLRLKGTVDADCLVLADMHSTAVDFSKSGRPVSRHAVAIQIACSAPSDTKTILPEVADLT